MRRGSSRSWICSPTRSTRTRMNSSAAPGKVEIHHWVATRGCWRLVMLPQPQRRGCAANSSHRADSHAEVPHIKEDFGDVPVRVWRGRGCSGVVSPDSGSGSAGMTGTAAEELPRQPRQASPGPLLRRELRRPPRAWRRRCFSSTPANRATRGLNSSGVDASRPLSMTRPPPFMTGMRSARLPAKLRSRLMKIMAAPVSQSRAVSRCRWPGPVLPAGARHA